MNAEYKPGLYRHFKGGYYRVIAIAKHSETQEKLVIYQSVSDESSVWARPYEMFFGPVDREKYPDIEQEFRFHYLGEDFIVEETE